MNHKYVVTLTDEERVVKLTGTRTAVDFAHFLRELVDIHYNHCEKIVLVMDNLNIHSISSLYKAFEPAIARQIAQRLEIHYTPIHASWLNMAEIEIGILSRQCLSQPLSSFELMARQVNAWRYQVRKTIRRESCTFPPQKIRSRQDSPFSLMYIESRQCSPRKRGPHSRGWGVIGQTMAALAAPK